MSQRIYESGNRNKLPRNKWGLTNESSSTGGTSSLYGGASQSSGGITGTNIISLEMVDLTDFKGASAIEDGERGLVPKPLLKQRNWFLKGGGERGDEKWSRVPAADWLYEWPKSEGLEKSGLGIDGDFHVSNTLTTWDLEVENAAHFWSLVIDEVRANGGGVIISPSTFTVDYVGEVVPYYVFDAKDDNKLMQLLNARTDVYNLFVANNVEYVRCRRLYQKCDDGERRIENKCIIGDMMRCRSFNVKADTYRNISNVDYWSFVVDGGEGSFTDTEGNTYDAIYIDLAFALTTTDKNIIPLGSTLHLDGTVDYPSGFEPYVADDLIEITADVWNGNRADIELQVFENEEWTSIQQNVIDIRGFDEQLEDITGEPSSRKMRTTELTDAEDVLNNAANGLGSNISGRRSVDVAQTVLNNDIGTVSATDFEEEEGVEITRQTLGTAPKSLPLRDSLILNRANKSNIVLAYNTVTSRDFIAADNLYDQLGYLTYSVGSTIPSGTTTLDNWRVVDTPAVDNAYTYVDETLTPVSSYDSTQINDFTYNTTSNLNRIVDNNFDTNYNELDSWQFGSVSKWNEFRIKKGDNLACLGHLYDASRQNAILLCANEGIDQELVPPYISQYTRIDTFGTSISKYRQTAIAANGNEFIGSFLVNYNGRYLDINERINLFITDIETGLEQVGIHLSGEDSTISLVGNVELRQHSNEDYDTLSVYDSLNQKRVEIIPKNIPARDSANNPVETTRFNFDKISEKKNAPSQYISVVPEKKKKGWFNYYWQYTYTLDNYILKYKITTDLGFFRKYDRLSLTNLFINLKCPSYLNGNEYIQLHCGIDFNNAIDNNNIEDLFVQKQYINKFQYTLKINGTDANGQDFDNVPVYQVDIPYHADGLLTDNINITSTEALINNLEIPITANYSIDIDIEYNVFAMLQIGTQYNNPYIVIDSSVNGYMNSYITRDKRKIDGVDVPLGKMTIGTNGFNFYNTALKFFYAGEDGYELKWGEADLTLDDTYGLRLTKPVLEIGQSSTKTIGVDYEIIVCDKEGGNAYTIYLPLAADYGSGREITISGYSGLMVKLDDMDSIRAPFPSSLNTITFGVDNSPIITLKMMAITTGWIVISSV